MGVCQPPLVGSGEHYFLIKYAEEISASLGCIRLLYSTNLANYATLPQARTQKTKKHTTTNMSRRRPTHQRLWPSLSMATSAMDLDLGAAAPYGSEAGAGVRCALAVAGFVDWSVGIGRTKNREMRQALVLGDRCLGILNNNQPDCRQNR